MTTSDPSSLLPQLPLGAEVLILRLRSLGDMVLETPAIAALHAWRSDLRICVLSEPWCAAVLEGNPAVSEVLISSGKFLETVQKLRRHRFPIVFNQHGGPRSALLTFASGAPLRVCWAGYQFSFLYNVQVPDKEDFLGTSDVHTVQHRMSQFYWAGLPRGPIPRAKVFPQLDAVESAIRKLQQQGIEPGQGYAVLQPAAREPEMRWPVAKFAEIAQWLREHHGIASVVNLGRHDDALADEVKRTMNDCAVVLDSLDVRELIALIARARLFVGNDSGPAHIAAAAGCQPVVIFGKTKSVEWRPWQVEHRVVEAEAQAISSAHGIADSAGVARISVDQVREACEDLLAAVDRRRDAQDGAR